jgi:hypothetical protein
MFPRSIINDSRSVIDDSRVMLQLVASFMMLIYDNYIFISSHKRYSLPAYSIDNGRKKEYNTGP